MDLIVRGVLPRVCTLASSRAFLPLRRSRATPQRSLASSLYLVEGLTALRVKYAEPGNEKNILLTLVSSRDVKPFEHEPMRHPPIRKTEEFLAVKAKVRPVIVLSLPNVLLATARTSFTRPTRRLRRMGISYGVGTGV
jgi:hypothetical protein